MSNPYFRFKQFTIRHDRCAMKVGTDGTLLGAWVETTKQRRILDIGTGTGLIALMLAQRCPEARIDGIDIDAEACLQALENVRQSPFGTRIRIVHSSFQAFASTVTNPYDLIVSNPPFFKDSLKCPEEKRRLARHDDSLPLNELLDTARSLLTHNGRLALILPFVQHEELLRRAEQANLHIIRRTDVIPLEGTSPKRLLVELSPLRLSDTTKDELILENRTHQRTKAYQKLTEDFYL